MSCTVDAIHIHPRQQHSRRNWLDEIVDAHRAVDEIIEGH